MDSEHLFALSERFQLYWVYMRWAMDSHGHVFSETPLKSQPQAFELLAKHMLPAATVEARIALNGVL